ncbi:sulfated surface glycoprotein 185-like [Malania oleifera]|uniref:sulfated surface glycoprotein 185-like n=1 Tax=Malania oleifera TaxID=397392 RepID=UPI0025AEBBC1|nr:sulfated surface glycoprotein 185-like [Malania oleifera]
MKRLKNFKPYYHLLHAFFMLCLVVLGSELDEVESEPPLPPPPEAQLLPPEPSLPPPESPLPPPESPMPPPEQSPLPPESPLQPPGSPLPPPESPLDANFYSQSCSTLGAIVGLQVMKALMVNARNAAYLVRLQFQDCFVNGCDASILLDGPNSEKVLGSNLNSTRGYELIDTIKQAVEAQCPGVVSCSDIIVLSAYYAATLVSP